MNRMLGRMRVTAVVWAVAGLGVRGEEAAPATPPKGVAALEESAPIARFEAGGSIAKINWLHFSPDGKKLYAAGDDKTLRIYDFPKLDPEGTEFDITLRSVFYWRGYGPEGQIATGALSPDGKWLALGGFFFHSETDLACSVRVIDAATGEIAGVLKNCPGQPFALTFSPDGRKLACGNLERTIQIWDLGAGLASNDWAQVDREVVRLKDVGWVNPGAAFTATNRLATAGYDGKVRFWEQTAKGEWKSVATGAEHKDKIRTLDVSADGKHVATGGFDPTLRLWDAVTGKHLGILNKSSGAMNCLVFAPDGQSVYSGGADGIIHQWSLEGEEMAQFPPAGASILAIAITTNAQWMAASTMGDGSVRLYYVPDARQVMAVGPQTRPMTSAGFSADGRTVAFGGGRPGAPLDLQFSFEKLVVERIPDSKATWFRAPAARDGLTIRKADRNVIEIRRDETNLVSKVVRSWGWDIIRAWAFVPGTNQVVVSSDFSITLNDVDTGKTLRTYAGHEQVARGLGISPDGRLLATASDDATLRLWNLQSGGLLATIFILGGGQWVAVTPSGHYACNADGDGILSWLVLHGSTKAAGCYQALQFKDALNKPEVVKETLKLLDNRAALAGLKVDKDVAELIRELEAKPAVEPKK